MFTEYLNWTSFFIVGIAIILTCAFLAVWLEYKMLRSIKSDVESIMIFLANEKMEKDEKNCGK